MNFVVYKFNVFKKSIISKIASYYKTFFYYISISNKLFYTNWFIKIIGIEKSIIVIFLIIISWLKIIIKIIKTYKTLKNGFNFSNKVKYKILNFLAI